MTKPWSSRAAWALLALGLVSAGADVANAQRVHRATAHRASAGWAPSKREARALHRARVVSAELGASGGALRVLATARAMIDRGVVVRGSCATWLGAVYRRAGGRFATVFSRSPRGGYADHAQLRPGDWVRFVNHSFHGVGHSAIFVGWTDPSHTRALTMSYTGQHRVEPGRYHAYDFRHVYQIDRMVD